MTSVRGFLHWSAMKFPEPLESYAYGNPEAVFERKQAAEQKASKRRQREEALADIAAVERRVSRPKPEERKPQKALDEFLAEEAAPKKRSEAWQAAEKLFT